LGVSDEVGDSLPIPAILLSTKFSFAEQGAWRRCERDLLQAARSDAIAAFSYF
jgi:hypothetical protein